MIKQETIQLYTIDEHPNPEAVFDWVRDNWHHLADFAVEEFITSLKCLADEIGGKLDYSIGAFPDRSEYISLKDYRPMALAALNSDDLPLTGCFYDAEVIKAAQNGNIEEALQSLHEEGEFLYSDKGIIEELQCREAYFTEDGAFHS